MGYGRKKDINGLVNRVEFLASNADFDLLEKICLLMGMDKSHVIRLAIRRLAVTMKNQGWPIDLPGVEIGSQPKSEKHGNDSGHNKL